MQITKAIVLRTIRYSDSCLVVSLYTEYYGMVSGMVRISRGAKGRSNGALWQLLNVLEIAISYSADAEMQKIGECSISVPWRDLPYNPMKASVAMFLADMLYHALRGE
jgi:DNA repair protein RecO (recombination protein O)